MDVAESWEISLGPGGDGLSMSVLPHGSPKLRLSNPLSICRCGNTRVMVFSVELPPPTVTEYVQSRFEAVSGSC